MEYIYIWLYIYSIYIYIRVYIYIAYIYIYIFIHTNTNCTYIYIYLYTHTYTPILPCHWCPWISCNQLALQSLFTPWLIFSRHPVVRYLNGLNRPLFLPFIPMLEAFTKVARLSKKKVWSLLIAQTSFFFTAQVNDIGAEVDYRILEIPFMP